jgi:hypothetical protein
VGNDGITAPNSQYSFRGNNPSSFHKQNKLNDFVCLSDLCNMGISGHEVPSHYASLDIWVNSAGADWMLENKLMLRQK